VNDGTSGGGTAVVLALGRVDGLVAQRLGDLARLVELSPPELASYDGDLDDVVGLIARGQSVVDEELMRRLPGLRVIARSGVGVDLVDVAAATARGIAVTITPNAGTRAVAEGTLAMILYLVKGIGQLTELVRAGRWSERDDHLPGDVDGAVLGVVGLGRIGTQVAKLATAFGMRVLAYDPYADRAAAASAGVALVSLEDLAASSHVVTLHAPLTEETRRIIGPAFFGLVRPGLVLVNSSRGGLVDLEAAHGALRDGVLGGLGLDVFDPEPPDPSHPLFGHRNVVFTPHVFGLSRRAWQKTFEELADGLVAVLCGRRPQAVANPALYLSATSEHRADH
jgi:D-3-phosphoglycerate dehydrogenase